MEIMLSALIIFLSIYKVLYFVQIYDFGIEIMTMIQAITMDLIPFFWMCLMLLLALTTIYTALHMGINDPDGWYSEIDSPLVKQFMQTMKLSSGDKTPPIIDEKMMLRLDGSES